MFILMECRSWHTYGAWAELSTSIGNVESVEHPNIEHEPLIEQTCCQRRAQMGSVGGSIVLHLQCESADLGNDCQGSQDSIATSTVPASVKPNTNRGLGIDVNNRLQNQPIMARDNNTCLA